MDILWDIITTIIFTVIITPIVTIIMTPFILVKSIFGKGRYKDKIIYNFKRFVFEWIKNACYLNPNEKK